MLSLSVLLVLKEISAASIVPDAYAATFLFPKTITPLLPNPIPVESPFAMIA